MSLCLEEGSFCWELVHWMLLSVCLEADDVMMSWPLRGSFFCANTRNYSSVITKNNFVYLLFHINVLKTWLSIKMLSSFRYRQSIRWTGNNLVQAIMAAFKVCGTIFFKSLRQSFFCANSRNYSSVITVNCEQQIITETQLLKAG